MENKLWFNQAGESYNGIPCDDIYGGCPVSQAGTPIIDTNPPVPLAIPAPNATDAQIANDPGYLQVLADGSVIDANGNIVSEGTDDGLAPVQPMLQAGQRVSKVFSASGQISANLMIGTVTGIIQKTLPAKYEIIWDNGTSSFDLASDVTPMPNQPVQPITEPIYSIGQEIVYNSYHNCPVGGGPIAPNDPCVVSGRGVIVGMDETSPVPRYQVQMVNGDIKFLMEGEMQPFQPTGEELSYEEKFCQDKVNGMSWADVDPNPDKENYYATCVQEQLALGDGTVFTPPSPVVVEPPSGADSCGKDKYALPIQIGEEKCIDKTLALVLGALAIYYIMTKK
tara:strand:- start:323 stop:1336 length:1014 start_codon:yes stop_codon:yes gene_type:complete